MEFRADRDRDRGESQGFLTRLSGDRMTRYSWPLAFGVLFLVAWCAVFVVGVFRGAGDSITVPACEWDRDDMECGLSAKALQVFLEKSKNPDASPWLDFSVCLQQDKEAECIAHKDCKWDKSGNHCLSEKYTSCLLSGLADEPAPNCGSMGAFAQAVSTCQQIVSKEPCKEEAKCTWNGQKNICAVAERYFVNLIFGAKEKTLKKAVLRAGDKCRRQRDESSCSAVIVPLEKGKQEPNPANTSDNLIHVKDSQSMDSPRAFLQS